MRLDIVDGLVKSYEEWLLDVKTPRPCCQQKEPYTLARDYVSGQKIDEKALQALADTFAKSEIGYYSGIFLSYIGNEAVPENQITLSIEKPFDCLGAYNNGKSWSIKGCAGDYVGYRMYSGTVMIEGDARDVAGREMRGGKLEINGNSGDSAGNCMRGGVLTISGDAGNRTGFWMEGGTLIINGKAESFSEHIKGGEIWESGKLVYKDGKRAKRWLVF